MGIGLAKENLFTLMFPREFVALLMQRAASARFDNVKSARERQAKHLCFSRVMMNTATLLHAHAR
jgi:hypothetical protein